MFLFYKELSSKNNPFDEYQERFGAKRT